MSKQSQVLARRHRWVAGATITECRHTQPPAEQELRRFTATIRGFRNWRIWQGDVQTFDAATLVREIKRHVTAIRDRIDRGDASVFREPGAW